MQITIRGDLTMNQLRQTIFEQLHQIEDGFNLHYSKGATLYFNPVDADGDPVYLRRDGKLITKLHTDGPYKSHADDFKI